MSVFEIMPFNFLHITWRFSVAIIDLTDGAVGEVLNVMNY